MIPEINLLPKYERRSSVVFILISSLIIIWLLLLALIVFQTIQTKTDKQIMETTIASLQTEKTMVEKQLEKQKSSESGSIQNAVSYAERLTAPTSILIEELLKLLPDHSYLSQYSYSNGQLSVQAQFETLDAVASYVDKITTSRFFTDVKVNNVSTFTLETDEEETEETKTNETQFQQVPRYDVSFSITVNRPALLSQIGGEENE